jgi:tRNA-Thr(GGU) m(6)t(6)A37 methyltransferase TsaA
MRRMQKFVLEPIGYIETCWKQKQGTPRQSMIIPNARGKLRLSIGKTGKKEFRQNTYHFVEGLEEFSHVWLFWIFHQNFHLQQLHMQSEENNTNITNISPHLMNKAKVRPPRLDGKKVGSLACRSPYRPNPIGMSVVKLDRIEVMQDTQDTILHLSGVDLVDQTPIIDIKPYIPEYDILQEPLHKVSIPQWMHSMRKQFSIDRVVFTDIALNRLQQFQQKSEFYSGGPENFEALKEVISQSIRLDPRSTYRREKFGTEVFGMCVDIFNLFVSIDDQKSEATVLDVEDWSAGIPSKEELKKKKYIPLIE